MTDDTSDIEKLAKLIEDFPIAMVATRADDRVLAQPLAMQQQHHRFDGDLWFLVSSESSTAERIGADPVVNVSLAANDSWVSLSGLGEITDESDRIHEMWDASAEAWFPDGADDPRIRALIVHVDSAEYWDTPGGRVATVLSFVKSKVTGSPMDIDTDKVDL